MSIFGSWNNKTASSHLYRAASPSNTSNIGPPKKPDILGSRRMGVWWEQAERRMLSKYLQQLNFLNIVLKDILWSAFGSFDIWSSFPTFLVFIYHVTSYLLPLPHWMEDGGKVSDIWLVIKCVTAVLLLLAAGCFTARCYPHPSNAISTQLCSIKISVDTGVKSYFITTK